MATKTVVCPECGAPAAPGRFACAQCGALIAAVGMQPREMTTLEPSTSSEAPPETSTLAPDEDAPDPATHAAADSGVTDPGFDTSPELDLPPTPAGLDEVLRPAPPAWPPAPAPERTAAGATAFSAAPAASGIRTPAGTYLPPSAVLPPLDGPSVAMAAAGAGTVPAGVAPAAPDSPSPGRRLPSLDGLFDGVELPARLTRRAVGVGSAIAAVSFLLPWINGLPGAGFDGYLDRWGLAGPGLWIVFLAAGTIGAIALSSGRTAAWPVGLPALILGSLVVGLVWPAVFGGGAAIGVWFAFVGAIVTVVGGSLDMRGRHGSTESSV